MISNIHASTPGAEHRIRLINICIQLRMLCCRRVTEGHQRSTASGRVSASALIPVPVRETVADEEMLMPMPKDVENLADDPQLHNPLQRSERMSTGWFGVSIPLLPHSIAVHEFAEVQRSRGSSVNAWEMCKHGVVLDIHVACGNHESGEQMGYALLDRHRRIDEQS